MLLLPVRNLRIHTKSRIFLPACRNLCSSATQPEVIPEQDAGDIYKSERDVPMLLLPYTVKKAHQVYPTSTSTPKVFDKYKWLMKTISSPGLPSNFVTTETNVEKEEIVQSLYDTLFHTVAYTKSFKNRDNPRYIPERINYSMLANFLQMSMYYGDDAPHLRPENSYLYHEPILETNWVRDYKFYYTKFRPDFVLRTKNGFDMIEEMDDLSPEMISMIPGPYNAYSLNMYRQSIVHLRNRPGMDNAKANPIKHCHTTIMHNNRVTKEEEFLTLGMTTMFAQLVAQAQLDGVLQGMDLKEPLVTQSIVTNGHQMLFMVYQLNTLHLLDDKGLWNRCWYSPLMNIFEPSQDKPYSYLIYEGAETGTELKGVNKDCFRLFINFMRNETS